MYFNNPIYISNGLKVISYQFHKRGNIKNSILLYNVPNCVFPKIINSEIHICFRNVVPIYQYYNSPTISIKN